MSKNSTMMSPNRKSMKNYSKVNSMIWDLPTPSNISYMWNFGSSLGVMMTIQILTGILLSINYENNSTMSFESVVSITKETWNGWMARAIHMNTASILFMLMYMHLFRNLYFMSSKNKMTWISGSLIMVMMMTVSFLGYVLPWGQMSYWGVAVITNLFSVIPVLGEQIVTSIWGEFSVSNTTLKRFFSMHYLIPMLIAAMIMMHLNFLHEKGSSNNLGMSSNMDKVPFHPYFSLKDSLFILMVAAVMLWMVSINPYMTLDPSNNIPANPMKTPTHIQPEWYFLPFYAILRMMPNKTMGVLMMVASVMSMQSSMMFKMKFSTSFSAYRSLKFWMTLFSFSSLMFLGALEAEEPFIQLSKMWSTVYFYSMITMNV